MARKIKIEKNCSIHQNLFFMEFVSLNNTERNFYVCLFVAQFLDKLVINNLLSSSSYHQLYLLLLLVIIMIII